MTLAVTNDHFEHGVALMEDFSSHQFGNQLLFALIVISDQCKKLLDTHKVTLLGNNKGYLSL